MKTVKEIIIALEKLLNRAYDKAPSSRGYVSIFIDNEGADALRDVIKLLKEKSND